MATGASDLGTILVDGKGMTLYLFTKDTQGSGASVCEMEKRTTSFTRTARDPLLTIEGRHKSPDRKSVV